MEYYDKEILKAKMTQNGVVEAIKTAVAADLTVEEAKEWLRTLSELYADAVKDERFYTGRKIEEAAKAETEVNE